MPFFVMLSPGAAAPPRPQAEREIQAVVSAEARPAGPDFEKADQSGGLAAPDDDLLGPPGDPGTETRLAAEPSGVAAQCASSAHDLSSRGHWKTVTTVISQSPKWGTVWRADVVIDDSPDSIFREVCWRPPQSAHGTVAVTIQPLQMFDPARSLAPLAAKAPPPAR